MRNDFYVGIFEDNYLAHGSKKGWVKRRHKYRSRYWKNGRWHYVYDDPKAIEEEKERELEKDIQENERIRKDLKTSNYF